MLWPEPTGSIMHGCQRHFLLQGSTRLDQKAEELLKGLFDGVPWEFERWKKDDPQGYISQVGGVSTVHLSAGPTQLAAW